VKKKLISNTYTSLFSAFVYPTLISIINQCCAGFDILSSCEGTGENTPLNFLISFHQVAGEQDFKQSRTSEILFTCNLVEGDKNVKWRIFTCALTRRHDVSPAQH
jgi:hypothetical protein